MRLAIILSIFLMSCSLQNSVPDFLPKVYKMDIKQGNEIDSEMLLELKPGMTKSQVKFVLGTPLIQDSFHNQRWDYLYVLRREGKLLEKRHVILNFEEDLLRNITGEVIPQDNDKNLVTTEKFDDLVLSEDKNKNKNKSDAVESSWIKKFKFWGNDTNITDDKNTNHEKKSNTKAVEKLNNNADLIQKIDVTESMNEAVKADIKNNDAEDLSGDNLNDKKILSEDKDVIINPKTDAKELDYFKLLLEKIGF
jgi:outer membrane protein assembly factor BamE